MLTRGAAAGRRRARRGRARRPGSAASGAGGPPVSVTTVAVQKRDVDVMLDATGTVTALNSVDIRPQVASTITKVHIKEGQFVNAGQLLFTLDARNDEVNVTKAQGAARQGPGGARRRGAPAGAQQGPVRAELHLAGRGRHQPDAGRVAARRRRRRPRRDRGGAGRPRRTAGSSRRPPGRAGAINVFAGSIGAAERRRRW